MTTAQPLINLIRRQPGEACVIIDDSPTTAQRIREAHVGQCVAVEVTVLPERPLEEAVTQHTVEVLIEGHVGAPIDPSAPTTRREFVGRTTLDEGSFTVSGYIADNGAGILELVAA